MARPAFARRASRTRPHAQIPNSARTPPSSHLSQLVPARCLRHPSISQVCDDYRLSTQTAWTAVHYFDRYLAARGPVAIERDEAELISLTCVFLAAKFIERQSPVRRKPN